MMVNRNMACLVLVNIMTFSFESFAMDEAPPRKGSPKCWYFLPPPQASEEALFSGSTSESVSLSEHSGENATDTENRFFFSLEIPRSSPRNAPKSSPKGSPKKEKTLPAKPRKNQGSLKFIYGKGYKGYCENLERWLVSKIKSNDEARTLHDLALAKNGTIKVRFITQLKETTPFYHNQKNQTALLIYPVISAFPKAKNLSDDTANKSPECFSVLGCLLESLGFSVNEKLRQTAPLDYSRPEEYATAMITAAKVTDSRICNIFAYGKENCGWHVNIEPGEESQDDILQLYIEQYKDYFATHAKKSPSKAKSTNHGS